jgi:hypothetical protein
MRDQGLAQLLLRELIVQTSDGKRITSLADKGTSSRRA